jgi:hypothetical protein
MCMCVHLHVPLGGLYSLPCDCLVISRVRCIWLCEEECACARSRWRSQGVHFHSSSWYVTSSSYIQFLVFQRYLKGCVSTLLLIESVYVYMLAHTRPRGGVCVYHCMSNTHRPETWFHHGEMYVHISLGIYA